MTLEALPCRGCAERSICKEREFTVPQLLSQIYFHVVNQEQHHRIESFQEEFRRLLRKYEIDFDERYVWD
jgi:hypothetical protein